MIVVIGRFGARVGAGHGLAAGIAADAAAAGSTVQFVATIAEGPDGDKSLLTLARADIGHAAVVRRGDGHASLEPADIELALRYLPDIRVVVATRLEGPLVAAVVDGAAWSDAGLIVVLDHGADVPAGLPAAAIVLEAPAGTTSGFAAFVARFAAALDRGDDPLKAVAAAERTLGADRVSRG